jgi:hypothetical protein
MKIRSITTFALCALLAAACGSTAEDICERADSCNALNGSVQECVETIENALDQLTSTQAEQAEFEMNKCLENPACGSFISCFNNIIDRRSDDGGGAGGGGSGPPPPPPPSGPGG